MAKKKSRKVTKRGQVKRSWRFEKISLVLFIFSFSAFCIGQLFVATINNKLSVEIQRAQNKIASYQSENKALAHRIQELSTKDRVISIAQEAGLGMVQSNIISVMKDD